MRLNLGAEWLNYLVTLIAGYPSDAACGDPSCRVQRTCYPLDSPSRPTPTFGVRPLADRHGRGVRLALSAGRLARKLLRRRMAVPNDQEQGDYAHDHHGSQCSHKPEA